MLERFVEKGPLAVPNSHKVDIVRKVLNLLEDEELTVHMAVDILETSKQAAIACTKLSKSPIKENNFTSQNAV
ncbi:hypothetical protein D3C76_865840 [compost metagenome]